MPRLPPVTRTERLITTLSLAYVDGFRGLAPRPSSLSCSAVIGHAVLSCSLSCGQRAATTATDTSGPPRGRGCAEPTRSAHLCLFGWSWRRGGRLLKVHDIDPAFTTLPLRALADAALSRARELGAQHADFRLERIRSQTLRLADAALETALDADDVGLSVRVVKDGTWGFAAGIDLTPGGAARVAAQAIEVAAVARAINR